MKIGKKTMKRGGESGSKSYEMSYEINLNNLEDQIALERVKGEKAKVDEAKKKESSQFGTELWKDKAMLAINAANNSPTVASRTGDAKMSLDMQTTGNHDSIVNWKNSIDALTNGGSKRKSKKSKKTKKGRGAHEGGKKKCPKHCRRKTSRTRKGLKHRKN